MRRDSLQKACVVVSGRGLASVAGVAALMLASAVRAAPLPIPFVSTPPTIDGAVGATEWANAVQYGLPHGPVYFENDATYLYVLFDMTGDTTLDTTVGNLDGFHVYFDVNTNGVGDPGVDVQYDNCLDGSLSDRQFLVSATSCSWTTCQSTTAVVARGFGPSPSTSTNHVIFEVAIPLSEISAQAGGLLRLGIGYYSVTPAINESVPSNPCAYSSYLYARLGNPPIPALGRVGLALLAALVAGAALWWLRRSSAS